MGFWVFWVEILYKCEELLTSSLFEETHQIGLEGFAISSWDLLDFVSSFAEESLFLCLEHVGAINT